MKTFDFNLLPENLQAVVLELPSIQLDDKGGAEFKVNPGPDPELGNMHVPVAQWLIKNGANRGEVVYITRIKNESN
jgi:hypothetical protein